MKFTKVWVIKKLRRIVLPTRNNNRYPYLIEIRPMLEKYKIKNDIKRIVKTIGINKYHKVPHITLIYNFRLKKGVKERKIIEIIRDVLLDYGIIEFHYNGFEIREGNGGYVVAFNIDASEELINARFEIYKKLKPLIKERSDVIRFNNVNKNKFWFHSTIGYNLSKNVVKKFKEKLKDNGGLYFPAPLLRISFLKNSKIVYEYDMSTKKILTRKAALSRKNYVKMLKEYRKKLNIDIKTPTSNNKEKNVWVISDTHFGHKNIIKYCARPFSSVKEMNNVIIKNWNNTVRKEDIVYFLGDMCFGRNSKSPNYWISKLNGNIIYIKGNHEKINIGKEKEIINYKGHKFLLLHDPNKCEGFDGWIIHGHKHNNDLINYPFINPLKKTINVSIELINYRPVSLDHIVDCIEKGNRIIETNRKCKNIL